MWLTVITGVTVVAKSDNDLLSQGSLDVFVQRAEDLEMSLESSLDAEGERVRYILGTPVVGDEKLRPGDSLVANEKTLGKKGGRLWTEIKQHLVNAGQTLVKEREGVVIVRHD